jgi:hypothetical protein
MTWGPAPSLRIGIEHEVPVPDHKLAEDETLYDLAVKNGLIWETIWNDPANKALKDKRQHPSALIEGDVVQIPDIKIKKVARPTDQLHHFALKGKPPDPITYKLAVEYGDFEAILKPVGSVDGKQQRLQGIGFYHGTVDGDNGSVTRRCWQHFCEEAADDGAKPLDDAAGQDKLKTAYRAILRLDDESGTAQTDFTSNARLMIPGTFSFVADPQLGNPLSAHRFNAEKAFFDANPALNRVPIVVKVTVVETSLTAPKVRVAFELVPPYGAPDDQRAYLNSISDVSERTSSPRSFIRGRLPAAANPPYGFNCPDDKGGKTPADAAGKIFSTQATDGFPWTPGTDARPSNFAVTVKTDDDGRAGVLFQPSHQGGDCYKIKVSVIVKGRAQSKDEVKEGGVITIWRNLRLSRIVEKAANGAFAGTPPVAAQMTGALGSISIATIRQEMTKVFMIVDADRHAKTPITMSAAQYREAMEHALQNAANPQGWDLNSLVKIDMASPFLLWLESDVTYNGKRATGTPAIDLTVAATWTQIGKLIDSLLGRFLGYWGGNELPGLVIIRSEIGDSYSYWNHPNKPVYSNGSSWTQTTSGVALSRRGCYVWYPNSIYTGNMPYGLSQNTMHEGGHVQYLRHHYTAGAAGTESGGFPANHDANDWCLMGYLPLTTNDYCGKCLLKLRGWDEQKL